MVGYYVKGYRRAEGRTAFLEGTGRWKAQCDEEEGKKKEIKVIAGVLPVSGACSVGTLGKGYLILQTTTTIDFVPGVGGCQTLPLRVKTHPSKPWKWRSLKERKHWALRPQKPLRLTTITRDGDVGGGGGQEFYI